MPTIRLHELAKELGVSSSQLIGELRAAGTVVRGPSIALKGTLVDDVRRRSMSANEEVTRRRGQGSFETDRLKVARAKVEIGIATEQDHHLLRLEEQRLKLSEPSTTTEGARTPGRYRARRTPEISPRARREQQRRLNAARKMASAIREEPLLSAKQRKAQRERQRMVTMVARQSAGGRRPQRIERRIASVVSGGLPSLGKGGR